MTSVPALSRAHRWWVRAAVVVALVIMTATNGFPVRADPGQTVVSITFDDGRASQTTAAAVLERHGLHGTFFANSGNLGKAGYLTMAELYSMASAGHEIGGHTLTHPHLEGLSRDETARQICDDRSMLFNAGFAVRSFAFPFGAASADEAVIARQCGYNSARGLNTLSSAVSPACQECAPTETIPPVDPLLTRAPAQVMNTTAAADLKDQVLTAREAGGWLQLTFHDLCRTECSDIATTEAEFEDFIAWLADEQTAGGIVVRNVGDVIGGRVSPPVTAPRAPPAAPGVNGIANPGLDEQADGVPKCWTQGGFGDNTREFSLVPDAHGGGSASRLVMTNHVNGDAKFLQTEDLGMCSPTVSPDSPYMLEAWYTSTVPTYFSVQYRLANGAWVYGTSSPPFPPMSEFSLASWTMPPVPKGVTAVSFGLALAENGELITDDYSLVQLGRP
jgi:peptidoglycan/xylan/chitin deacetylase (PgdA/CDA1 family)